jgi:hypothetical protein
VPRTANSAARYRHLLATPSSAASALATNVHRVRQAFVRWVLPTGEIDRDGAGPRGSPGPGLVGRRSLGGLFGVADESWTACGS